MAKQTPIPPIPTKPDELKDLVMLARQLIWQYQLDNYTDEALKTISKVIDKARLELESALTLREVITLEELNNLAFGVQAVLTDSIETAGAIAGKASYVEYNNILSFDGKIGAVGEGASAAGGVGEAVGVGFNAVSLSPAQITALASQTLIDGAVLGNWISRSFANAFNDSLLQEFKELQISFGSGMLQGESIKELVKRVPETMDLLKRDAITLTRTYIATINNNAAYNVYKANSDIIKQEEWNATLEISGRGSSTCLRCAGLHGRRYNINEPHIRPPLHPRCRCVMLPITKSWRELGLDIDDIQQAANTYSVRTPVNIDAGRRGTILEAGQFRGSFEEFLESQPAKYTEELLGANRARFLREGKIKFQDLVDENGDIVLLKRDKDGHYIGLM